MADVSVIRCGGRERRGRDKSVGVRLCGQGCGCGTSVDRRADGDRSQRTADAVRIGQDDG
ncbi:hypothetical protein GFD24_10555 [Bifidobacterium ramosum]|uniref:Uncharacterized protein n=1 Tax=Bifidobacterium ramosum TaxID=1798158 RepID=A0A7K3TFW7_9BIFI|nr:hypothetical protein [Bifidobacterium ramosum]